MKDMDDSEHNEVMKIQLASALQEIAQAKKNLNFMMDRCNSLEAELGIQRKLSVEGIEFSEFEEISKLRRALERTKHEKNEQALRNRILEEKVEVLTAIEQSLRDQLKENREAFQLKARNKTREVQIKKQLELIFEKQIRLRTLAEELMNELSLASQLNPNFNLLKITEFELNKVELALKKTPTSDPNRKNLETSLESLTEQRNFLRFVNETSQQAWNQKFEKLKKLLQDSGLEELPPLAPAPSPGAPLEHEA